MSKTCSVFCSFIDFVIGGGQEEAELNSNSAMLLTLVSAVVIGDGTAVTAVCLCYSY